MYNFHRSLSDLVLKTMRQVDSKAYDKWDHVKAAHGLIEMEPMFVSTLDFLILIDEIGYIEEDLSVSYFIKDLDAYSAISDMHIEEIDPMPLITQSELFTLAFPNECPLQGLLVSINTVEDFDRRIKRLAPLMGGIKGEGVTDTYSINIAFCIGKDLGSGVESYARVNLPLSRLNDVLRADSAEDYGKIVPLDRQRVGATNLTPQELAYQFMALQFVARFLVYRAAASERFAEGTPGVEKRFENKAPPEKSTKFLRYAKRSSTFSVPEVTDLTEHYRRAHIRQLWHDRYYRGEHAVKARGSRLVFVLDTVVHHKARSSETADARQ